MQGGAGGLAVRARAWPAAGMQLLRGRRSEIVVALLQIYLEKVRDFLKGTQLKERSRCLMTSAESLFREELDNV